MGPQVCNFTLELLRMHLCILALFWFCYCLRADGTIFSSFLKFLHASNREQFTFQIMRGLFFVQVTTTGAWCNLNLEIISPGSRTRDFTVICRYNYRYAVNAFIRSDERIHGVAVVIPTNHCEIPGSTPGRYNLQIKITSKSWSCGS